MLNLNTFVNLLVHFHNIPLRPMPIPIAKERHRLIFPPTLRLRHLPLLSQHLPDLIHDPQLLISALNTVLEVPEPRLHHPSPIALITMELILAVLAPDRRILFLANVTSLV